MSGNFSAVVRELEKARDVSSDYGFRVGYLLRSISGEQPTDHEDQPKLSFTLPH